MADSSVPITAGSGTNIDTFQLAGGDHQQVIREAPASAAAAPSSWSLSLSANTTLVAADVSRRCVILTNTSGTGTVYLRYDTTAPTTAAGGWHDRILPSGRLVLEKEAATLALSSIADVAAGYLEIALLTAA